MPDKSGNKNVPPVEVDSQGQRRQGSTGTRNIPPAEADSQGQRRPGSTGTRNVPPAEADPQGQRRPGSSGSASTSSEAGPQGITRVASLGSLGFHSRLERKQVERTHVTAAADEAERKRVERDQQKLRDGFEEIRLPKRHGGFHFRHKGKHEKHVLIVEKRDQSEQRITEGIAKLHRFARSDEDAEKAFNQLVQIHDLGGLEDVFSEEMQSYFRKFMMDWKLGLVRAHTKMRVRDTNIPWVGTTAARHKLTKCKKFERMCGPHCCGKVPYSTDLSTVQSLEAFESMSCALTNSPSRSKLAMKAKRLRDELFDPNAPAWIYERELGVLLKGPRRTDKINYDEDDESTFQGSSGTRSGGASSLRSVQTLGRQDERAGESRLPRRGISFYVSLKPSKNSRRSMKPRAAISDASKITIPSKKSSTKKKKE